MGLDGFSMSNLGLYNRMTSAQMANEAENIASRNSETQIKDIDALEKKRGVEKQDTHYREGGYGSYQSSNEEDSSEERNEVEEIEDYKKTEQTVNRFEMRINADADIVELFDNEEQRTVQRITTKDLLAMVKKYDDPSGVLINKKI